nr:M23 family metallopeptidase [Parvularcula maris]
MKTPINGARVTSRFGRRRHPVLGYDKGHKGVDFGAPRGTPILAAGDGTVKLAGPRGTFGNYIRLEHAGGYETAYAHLQGFAKGIVSGKRVRQGEVIGYVGTTGRSTGPHLHYEVLAGGVHQNPETIKVAVGETLTAEALELFAARKSELNSLRTTPFAIVEATLP